MAFKKNNSYCLPKSCKHFMNSCCVILALSPTRAGESPVITCLLARLLCLFCFGRGVLDGGQCTGCFDGCSESGVSARLWGFTCHGVAGASIVPKLVWLAFGWSLREEARKERAWLKTTRGSPGMIKVTWLPVSWAELRALERTGRDWSKPAFRKVTQLEEQASRKREEAWAL